MKMPGVEKALVEENKVINYLLSPDNSEGKQAFFTAFGFTIDAWEILRNALLQHAMNHEVNRSIETIHGHKYVIEGELSTPDGRLPVVRTVWITDKGRDFPRLVTAYPVQESGE
ncbi:MAG: hypothetical protein SF029_09900 [bacterium]|nr:hypothetical protein [bacterium]